MSFLEDKRSIYDEMMANDLNFDLDYFYSLVDSMIDRDLMNFYFYLGQYHTCSDCIEIKKQIDKILNKYQRKDKLKKLIDEN